MNLLKTLRSIFILAYMFSILWIVRNLLSLIYLFFAPFTVLFLLYALAGSEVLPYALVGAYIMTLVQAGAAIIGDAAWHKLELKFQDMMVASPVSETAYLLAEALSELLYSAPALIILLLLILQFKLSVFTLFTLLAVALLVWLSTSSLGFFISTYIPNIRNGWQISLLLGLFLAVLPPVFYPIERVPEYLLWAAYLPPTTHAALLLRDSIGLTSPLPLSYSWLILIAYTLTFMALATYRAQWREK
ncbi:MAG: ABC transporter permease [Nitrososphaerales archaeon]